MQHFDKVFLSKNDTGYLVVGQAAGLDTVLGKIDTRPDGHVAGGEIMGTSMGISPTNAIGPHDFLMAACSGRMAELRRELRALERISDLRGTADELCAMLPDGKFDHTITVPTSGPYIGLEVVVWDGKNFIPTAILGVNGGMIVSCEADRRYSSDKGARTERVITISVARTKAHWQNIYA